MILKAIFVLSVVIANAFAIEVDSYDIMMPNVTPHREELYLCTPVRIAPRAKYSIVGFKPNSSMVTAHHMLLYGCTEPGANDEVWNCGEMQGNDIDGMYNTASPCKSGSQIVYAWARDAPALDLPEGVGFLVGKDSPIKYLVLQVHYVNKFEEGRVDTSGVTLMYTKEPMPRQAGVYLLGTGGMLSPHHVEHMETACTLRENKIIHPFAFRTHTHSLGKVVSGYAIRTSEDGQMNWQLIGKKDPLLPQMFYPVQDNTPLGPGVTLAARCTMDNTLDHFVKIGATNKDEMCNFYIMYYVENDTPLEQKYCFTPGPPSYHWVDSPALKNIPEEEASAL